jgi:hypothetical protein
MEGVCRISCNLYSVLRFHRVLQNTRGNDGPSYGTCGNGGVSYGTSGNGGVSSQVLPPLLETVVLTVPILLFNQVLNALMNSNCIDGIGECCEHFRGGMVQRVRLVLTS